jgi:fructosamine-3-kinase
MTRLFGGFGSDFYDAYDAAWPLPPGHERRVALYQLYHVLNHLNLFGAGYLGKAVSLMKRLLG